MEQACALELVRGSNCFSDNTVWIKGDCWPPFTEVVTRYPLCGGTKLNVFVKCVEGQSELIFGLISPHKRSQKKLSVQNGEPRLNGKLWAWNSKYRKIFNKPFDSRTSYGSSSQIVQFYDEDISTGSVLGVYRDLKTNYIYFVANEKKGMVSFSSGAPDLCFGYVRLKTIGSDGKIQVTVLPEIKEISLLSQYSISPWSHHVREICSPHHVRGICLLINNIPELSEAEKQLTDLFKSLFFDVQIRRSLKRNQINEVAEEFAKKDHSEFDSFVFIAMSFGQDDDIHGVDRKKASLVEVMTEYTATNCPTLRCKPKLFFVQRFTALRPSKFQYDLTQSQCCTDEVMEMQSLCPPTCERNCPEEADFLLACVTSAICKAKPRPDALFIQALIETIRKYCDRYHLLDLLTKVNECMADKQRQNGVKAVHVPYLNHTLRSEMHLALVPRPDQRSGSTNPGYQLTDGAQRDRYELDKRPRGYCVIINNVRFRDKAYDRLGAEEDERILKQIFDDLFFTVIVERDLTREQMEDVAEKYGCQTDHSTFNAFVMIVMSHGEDNDCILGVDGKRVFVKDLMVQFQELKCPSLKEKPKVFIIQACRGSRKEVYKKSWSQAVTSTSADEDDDIYDSFSPDSTLPRSVFPREFDFVLAFATVPGYVSWRSPKDGTFFIQSLAKIIGEHRHRHHFLEILMKVTELVVQKQSQEKPVIQVPAFMHTLTKCLYL